MTEEHVQELMDLLTGKSLPEGMTMPKQPKLKPESAFSVIWFLQEHLHLIPDKFEMCDTCKMIFDSYADGYISDDGKKFCSPMCEDKAKG